MPSPDAETLEVPIEYRRLVKIHGRNFQKFSVDHAINFVPVDEEEADRLDALHKVFNTVFDRRLIFPLINDPKMVLDCGYGAGSWAVAVAESYPQCEVIGVDISPHMKPDFTPTNFEPQLDDMNKAFTFPANHFDLVHSRMVGSGINKARWPSYLRDIKKVLKPGGWVQLVESYFQCQSDNGSITDAHAIRQWSNKYMSSIAAAKDPRAPLQLQNMLTTAGFVSVEFKMIRMPLCGWPNDARERRIGNEFKDVAQQILGTLALYPFTKHLNMSINEANNLIARARADAANPSLKAYFPLYVCIGKKPG